MRILLFIFFLTVSDFVFSQNITFDQAQNLRKKSLAEVETFLTAKNWRMTAAEESTDNKMGKATFGFNVDQFDSDIANGWIVFYESNLGDNYNRFSIQIHQPSLYSTFISRLSPNAYKLKSSKIIDGGIRKVYANTTTTCIITTSTNEGLYTKATTYLFFFIDNLSYKLTFEDQE